VAFWRDVPENVFARTEHESIDHYVVEEVGDKVLKTFKTQEEAIGWAKSRGDTIHVARVRHLSDKRNPDHWRKAV
jgi:hypothetical protein